MAAKDRSSMNHNHYDKPASACHDSSSKQQRRPTALADAARVALVLPTQ